VKRLSIKTRLALVRIQRRRERRRLSRLEKFYSPGQFSSSLNGSGGHLPDYTRLQAPKRLEFTTAEFPTALRFLARIREIALTAERGVYIDLKHCEHMSAVVALMLCAEIERCRSLRFGSVNGCDPDALSIRFMLRAMGFHRRLGIRRGKSIDSTQIVTIRSGGRDDDVARELQDVASVARRALKDPALANRIHGALNEAMLNVSMHAYDPAFFKQGSAPSGRWWVAGLADPEKNEVMFFAYDHGVGIARTAPRNVGDDLMTFLDQLLAKVGLMRADAQDHHVIEAAIKARKSRTGLPQHGKGLTSMIQLVDRVRCGTVWICSGAGQYLYSKPDNPSEEPVEGSTPLEYSVPGTLIIWRLVGGPTSEGIVSNAHAT